MEIMLIFVVIGLLFMPPAIGGILLIKGFNEAEEKSKKRRKRGLIFFTSVYILYSMLILYFMFSLERVHGIMAMLFIPVLFISVIFGTIFVPIVVLIIAIKGIKKAKGSELGLRIFGIIISILHMPAVPVIIMIFNMVTEPIEEKPVIYLYPTEETDVNVKLGIPQNLRHTYPKYETEWNVLAKPNGDLTDLKTDRQLYCLYWEGINTIKTNMSEGFVVEGKSIIAFLEEKLKILGLTEREANEFIIYWLPQLENNKYNFIRFQTIEEINKNMPLQVTPNPDSVIRIVMEFKKLNRYIEIPEQNLITPVRNGFVVVEWGGTRIK